MKCNDVWYFLNWVVIDNWLYDFDYVINSCGDELYLINMTMTL